MRTHLQLAGDLARAEGRADAARRLAETLGGESLIVFLRDDEVNSFVAGPGFPQTFPNGRLWREFLRDSAEKGEHRGELAVTSPEHRQPAIGISTDPDSVLVLLGTDSPSEDPGWLREILPLISASLRGERTAELAATRADLARDAAHRAAELAQILDGTRRRLEEALRSAGEAQLEVETANEHLREQAESLESLAVELELQADELKQANSLLEEAREIADTANRVKSDFLATMSHELRTPLNAIGGHLQLLSMGIHGPVAEAQQGAFERINRSQRHLLSLINDILNMARLEAGRVEYDIGAVSLGEILSDLRPMIEPQLGAKSLSLDVSIGDDFPRVLADREKLQQIFLNLLSNSVKFTDSGGSVSIAAALNELEPDKACVSVRDNGQGIPPERLGSIFEPFTQVDSSHSRMGGGAGLGLAISRDLARGMGGDLTVESEPGVGSKFTLTLPKAD